MKNRDNRTLMMSTLLCLVPILFSLLVYDKLPQQIPIHWNINGEIDTYAPKFMGAIGLPAIIAVINVVLHVFVYNDPKRQNFSKRMKMIVLWMLPIISLTLNIITILICLGFDIDIHVVVPILVGILIMVMGNYLPKCKQNYTMGIRIPWTLAHEDNWNKTHRLAGFLYVIAGFMMICNTIFLFANWFFVIIVAVVTIAIIPIIYSFYLYQKTKN